ncbi:MAG: hypothetical protein HZA53_09020 [Planctomycetes bacterium]|nr:hypothetical protein [Planctomycetota bacterium]
MHVLRSLLPSFLALSFFAACTTTASMRDMRGSTAEGAVAADTHAVFEVATAVVNEHVPKDASRESRTEWVALGGSTDTVQTWSDGGTDQFREKGTLHVKLAQGFLHVEVRRDASLPAPTIVRVRVHEVGGATGDAAFARELLDAITERALGGSK